MKNPKAALSAKSYPRSVAWRVDVDYLAKLNPDEQAWLAAFLDRHYAGDFRGDVGPEWTTEERRASYRDKNAANRDLMTCSIPSDSPPPDPSIDFDDLEPDDGLDVDSAQYRSARAAFRAEPTPANRVRLARARIRKRPIGS